VCQFPGCFYPAAERRGFGGRWRIDESPRNTDNEQGNDKQASGDVKKHADIPRGPARKVVAKRAQEPRHDNESHCKPVNRLGNGTVALRRIAKLHQGLSVLACWTTAP
jgi:hypothetical protein